MFFSKGPQIPAGYKTHLEPSPHTGDQSGQEKLGDPPAISVDAEGALHAPCQALNGYRVLIGVHRNSRMGQDKSKQALSLPEDFISQLPVDTLGELGIQALGAYFFWRDPSLLLKVLIGGD